LAAVIISENWALEIAGMNANPAASNAKNAAVCRLPAQNFFNAVFIIAIN